MLLIVLFTCALLNLGLCQDPAVIQRFNQLKQKQKLLQQLNESKLSAADWSIYDLDLSQSRASSRAAVIPDDSLPGRIADEEKIQLCEEDLRKLQFDAKLLKPYALYAQDSEGKRPPGLMVLNINWMGFYDECTQVNLLDPDAPFPMKYCWSPVQIIEAIGGVKGVCVPNTCDADSLNIILNRTGEVRRINECVESVPWITGDYVAIGVCGFIGLLLLIGTTYDVIVRSKQTSMEKVAKEKHNSTNGSMVKPNGVVNHMNNGNLTNNSQIIVENGQHFENKGFETELENGDIQKEPIKLQYTTQNEHLKTQEKTKNSIGHEILLAFSILTNGEKLFNFTPESSPLTCLNGLRSLSFGWVILGHAVGFVGVYQSNLVSSYTAITRLSYQIILSGLYAVDTFFFLSGLLVSYSAVKMLHKSNGKLNWAVFYIHRYIRLSVLYGFVILISATLWRHCVKSPFTEFVEDGRDGNVHAAACQKYWWTNLLYINNFYPDMMVEGSCNGVGWYMAIDMQLYIISPIFLYLLYKNNKIGHLFVAATILASMLTNGIVSSKYDLSSLMLSQEPQMLEPEVQEKWWNMYVRTYYRMCVYFVGMATGELLLHKLPTEGSRKNINMHWMIVSAGWILSLTLHYTLMFGMYPYYEDAKLIGMSRHMDALYNATHRTAWAISLAWIVYMCYHGYGGPINWFLSWRIWGPIGRLSFAGYLFHPMVMTFLFASIQQTIHLNDYSTVMIFTSCLFITLVGSTILSLAIESPVIRLLKLLLQK